MEIAAADFRWTLRYPELGTAPVPVAPDISSEYFEQEREKIFRRVWLNVGRVEELPEAGSYVVRDLPMLNASIIVVRGRDDVIRGFHNVCKHRGNKLTMQCQGRAKSFVCGFHGWAFDTTGRLVHVPDEEQFFGFDKADYPLTPVTLDVWEGFIFINAAPQPTETMREWMGELNEQLCGYPFDAMDSVAHYVSEVNANWKVCMDISQESYHVSFVHKRIVPDSNSSRDNPYSHAPSMIIYKRHRSKSSYANPAHKPTPAEALAFRHGPTVLQGAAGRDALPKGVNPTRSPLWAFDPNVVFPNFILLLGNGWYVTHNYWPLAVDRTRWETRLYFRRAHNAGQRIGQEFSKILTRDLLREDLGAVEVVQQALASGVLKEMPLSDQEIMLRHQYKIVDEFINQP